MKNKAADVLLVEDDVDHAELIRTCLDEADAAPTVVWVRDGREALAYLRSTSGPPRLVLLDLRLPELDGLEVLAELKGARELRGIPVLMLTTSRHDGDVERAYDLGANGYVVKPERFEELAAMLRDVAAFWLQRNRAPTNSSAGTREPTAWGVPPHAPARHQSLPDCDNGRRFATLRRT